MTRPLQQSRQVLRVKKLKGRVRGRSGFRQAVAAIFFGGAVLGAGMAVPPAGAQTSQGPVDVYFPKSELKLKTESGAHRLQIELATTPTQRSRGLMFRDHLDDDQGMLFDFGRETGIAMWMKDTPLSLDMIFISADGRVVDIARNTTPFSLEVIKARARAQAVLEVKAGIADKLGLKLGDRVEHERFR